MWFCKHTSSITQHCTAVTAHFEVEAPRRIDKKPNVFLESLQQLNNSAAHSTQQPIQTYLN